MTQEQRICKGLELIESGKAYKYTKWKETTINKHSHSYIRDLSIASFEYDQGLSENRIRKIKTVKLLVAGMLYLRKWGVEHSIKTIKLSPGERKKK